MTETPVKKTKTVDLKKLERAAAKADVVMVPSSLLKALLAAVMDRKTSAPFLQ